jgi:hypothetical protein
MITARVV